MINNNYKRKQLLLHEKLKSKIRAIFRDYKEFMNEPDLTLPNIEVFDALKEPIRSATTSTVIYPQKENQPLRFRTEQFNLEIYGSGVEAYYYNLFTQISNYYSLRKLFDDYESFIANAKIYSTFNSTIIEMKKALGFTNIYDSKVVSLDGDINISESAMSIQDYFKQETLEYKREIPKWINKYMEDRTPKALAILLDKLLTHAIRYFGKVYILEKYCKDNIDEAVDVLIFTDIFGNEIINIFELLKTPTVTKEILLSISNCENKIKDEFYKKYIPNNM